MLGLTDSQLAPVFRQSNFITKLDHTRVRGCERSLHGYFLVEARRIEIAASRFGNG
jgi:hypothetical protein